MKISMPTITARNIVKDYRVNAVSSFMSILFSSGVPTVMRTQPSQCISVPRYRITTPRSAMVVYTATKFAAVNDFQGGDTRCAVRAHTFQGVVYSDEKEVGVGRVHFTYTWKLNCCRTATRKRGFKCGGEGTMSHAPYANVRLAIAAAPGSDPPSPACIARSSELLSGKRKHAHSM